ncbi:MAG: NlpC/P60 family protein [Mycobacteriaceae bacterium]
MAKHRLKEPVRGSSTARNVLVAGAITFGFVAVTAAPASAAPVTIPGFGTFDIPWLPVPPELPVVVDVAPAKDIQQIAVDAAMSKIGSPYSSGAAGPSAFDCSGLVYWAFQQAGVTLPRTSYDQASGGAPVAKQDLRVGDVVAFYSGASHVGIYLGDGKVVHASTYGTPVQVAPLDSMPYYNARRY